MYVEDAAEATVRVLNAEYHGIINIASGIPRKMKDVFSEVALIMGSEEHLSFSSNYTCKTVLVADTDILNNQIGYTARTYLKVGLGKTIAWWKNRYE
jgi:nucleoside-diphosphate-sugar epimerase